MIDLDTDIDDDPAFTEQAFRLIAGTVAVHWPTYVRVYKVDNWFGHKWMAFSGKVMGALPVWKKKLTVPPFVANRRVNEWRFQRIEGLDEYRPMAPGREIHFRGPAAVNLNRRIADMVPTTAVFWFSGNTAATGQGSLMGYVPIEGEHWTWFLSFRRYYGWRIVRMKKIYEYEVRRFCDAANAGA